jgi:hypothetical protein
MREDLLERNPPENGERNAAGNKVSSTRKDLGDGVGFFRKS